MRQNPQSLNNKYLPDFLNEEIVESSSDTIEIVSNNMELKDLQVLKDHILEHSLCSFANIDTSSTKYIVSRYLKCHHYHNNSQVKSKGRKLKTG